MGKTNPIQSSQDTITLTLGVETAKDLLYALTVALSGVGGKTAGKTTGKTKK